MDAPATIEVTKIDDRRSLVLWCKTSNTREFVVCSHYDASKPIGSQWVWGHYFKDLISAVRYAYDIPDIDHEERLTILNDIIEIFENFLDEKGIIIPNEERDYNENLDDEESSNIYGTDYGNLSSEIENVLINAKLLPSEEE